MDFYAPNNKHMFMSDIIKMLHLKMDLFIYNLAHDSLYEQILYAWINKLYEKGKTSEEAVQLIYKARNILLLNPKNGLCSPPASIKP